MIAEIAAIFHWPLGELARLSLDDLIYWRNAAVGVFNRLNKAKAGQ